MAPNRLLVLESSKRALYSSEITVTPEDADLQSCSLIAFASFVNNLGVQTNHVWISYKLSPLLVSFNANTKKQRAIVNITDRLNNGGYINFVAYIRISYDVFFLSLQI